MTDSYQSHTYAPADPRAGFVPDRRCDDNYVMYVNGVRFSDINICLAEDGGALGRFTYKESAKHALKQTTWDGQEKDVSHEFSGETPDDVMERIASWHLTNFPGYQLETHGTYDEPKVTVS